MQMANLNKFSKRVINSSNKFLIRRRNRLEKINYEVLIHTDEKIDRSKFIFTVSIATYNRYDYLKTTIESVLNQTYKNIEIIIIDQSVDEKVSTYCHQIFILNKNVKLIRTKGEPFLFKAHKHYEDLNEPVLHMWNAALFISIGDCIYPLSDDDYFSSNFVEKMVDLFIFNKNCHTCGGNVQSINQDGEDNPLYFSYGFNSYTSPYNFLANYMKQNKGDFFSAPGTYFTVRSQTLIECGGWDILSDDSPIFRCLIYGDFGYDADATLFWRHHSNQAHHLNNLVVMYETRINWLKEYQVAYYIENILGKEIALKFRIYYDKFMFNMLKQIFFDACRSGMMGNIIGVAAEIRSQTGGINIFKHVSILYIIKIYLHAILLNAYLKSNFLQKWWKALKSMII